MSLNQSVGQYHITEVADGSFENAAEFKHFGVTLINRNCVH